MNGNRLHHGLAAVVALVVALVTTLGSVQAATLAVDVANGFAYPAVDLALKELPAIVRETGIAAATISPDEAHKQ